MLEYVLRMALSRDAEPLPGYGRADMYRLSEYIGQLAQKKGLQEFERNHPSKTILESFFLTS